MEEPVKKPVIFVFSTAYHPFIGGAEVATEQVAKRLKDRFDFVIFTSLMDKNLPRREARPEGVVIRIGFGTKFDKFWLLLFGWFAAWRELRKLRRKKVFWVMDFSFGAAAAGFLKIFYPKVPLIFTIQYGYGDERVAKGRFGLMNLAFRLILAQTDYVTAISSYLLNLTHQYGYIGEEAVIHNGVDVEKFKVQNSKFKITNQDSKIIVTVSRLVPKNGVDILIKAVAELKKEIPDAELVIIGDGPERKKLEELAEKVGGWFVTFGGSVLYDELPKRLAQADVFVRPSRSEGMGNAFVEALAAGLPIVGTPVEGILDIIEDGKTGLFAKVDDPKDLAEKIKILLEDKKLAARIVENGRKMISKRFDWNKIAELYNNIFEHELVVKKRVLIATGIFPPDVGGPAQYAKNLREALKEAGHEVRIAVFGYEHHLLSGLRHLCFFFKVFIKLARTDFCIALDTFSVGLPAVLACKFLGKKILIRAGGDFLWEEYVERTGKKVLLKEFYQNEKQFFSLREKIIFCLTSWALRRSAALIFSTEWQKNIWQESYRINPAKLFVVENFYGPKHFSYQPETKIFVAGARRLKLKNFAVLERAFAAAREQNPGLILDLSNAAYEDFLQKIQLCYAVVSVSLSEISPNIILDAIRYNKPFILTKETGLYDKIKNIGVFADPLNEREIAEKILFLSQPQNYEEYKRRIENFNYTHSWQEIAGEFLSVYKKIR